MLKLNKRVEIKYFYPEDSDNFILCYPVYRDVFLRVVAAENELLWMDMCCEIFLIYEYISQWCLTIKGANRLELLSQTAITRSEYQTVTN
jgi:hypothetical protein